jgi:hypothetical protein
MPENHLMLSKNSVVPAFRTGVIGKVLAALALLAVATTVAAQDPPDIGGVWLVSKYETGVRTNDGQLPPLTAAGKAIYENNLVTRKELKPRNDMTRCVPSGTPRVMWAPLPMLILQTARKITFVHEYHHQLRHIYLDEPLPSLDVIELSFMGESVGHWEGDTLVIETIGLHRDTVLDREGLPHSTNMQIVERMRLLDSGQLEDVMTLTDPEMYETPWTTRVVYDSKPGVQLKEYNCLLVNEDL